MLVGKGADVEMVNDMGQFLRIYLRLSSCYSFPGSSQVCKALLVNDMGQFLRIYLRLSSCYSFPGSSQVCKALLA
jgi:hypothetical protein